MISFVDANQELSDQLSALKRRKNNPLGSAVNHKRMSEVRRKAPTLSFQAPMQFRVENQARRLDELNHSETAFIHRPKSSPSPIYEIRWFTPHLEEAYCGHGLVAAAHALSRSTGEMQFTFRTVNGMLASASIQESASGKATISLALPSSPIHVSLAPSADVRLAFAKALRINADQILTIGQNPLRDIILELAPSLDFSANALDIDPAALLEASPMGTRSQVLTSSWELDPSFDFAKRVFAYGVEDQATGSTYSALAPYWGERLGKRDFMDLQPSSRGGSARVRWKEGDGGVEVLAGSVRVGDGLLLRPGVMEGMRARL
ncbi:hypothetical protein BJ875DRAFT_538740 [Amylocarpus encephaloides]|uniref:Uncharacterized protein n=1 Tax=Amylocarpus encephaloides TaxID=45428 RepID=A0A9P7YU95_9HELO|nr:hypothetical protein BJ875DRAFT_538740 [Amylocarpus encephaloides]